MEKKILVTGASGFIGANLLRHPFFVDACTIGRSNLSHSGTHIFCTMEPNTNFRNYLEGYDVVIHLAGRAHVMKGDKNEEADLMRAINRDLTINLASHAASAGVKKFIFLSSAKVLGERTGEDDIFDHLSEPNPTGAYAISKAEAERGLKDIMERYHMEVTIVRPPLVYGKGVKGNFNDLSKLINPIFPLPLASINNKRSMISVSNLIEFLIVCVLSEEAGNKTFLISDGIDVSTAELVRVLCTAKLGRNTSFPFPKSILRILFSMMGMKKKYDKLVEDFRLDISYTKSTLNWTPVNTLQSELIKY